MNAADEEPIASAAAPLPTTGITEEDDFVPRCPHCDYILVGLTVERCPECGRRFSLSQLRAMHLRRKPTPWEDPDYCGGRVRRYLATWRVMLRPPFFLFLARPTHAGRAIRFAAVTLLLLCMLWIGVVFAEMAYFGSSWWGGGPMLLDCFGVSRRLSRLSAVPAGFVPSMPDPLEVAGAAISGVVVVPVSYLLLVLLLRAGLVFLPSASLISRNKLVVRHIVVHLSCWFLAGTAVFVVGIAARMPVDMTLKFIYVPMDFMIPVIALAELVLMAVWCCHADAAMRDGLEGKSKSFGPILILITVPLSLIFGGLLTSAILSGLVGLL